MEILNWGEIKHIIDSYSLKHGLDWTWTSNDGSYKIFAFKAIDYSCNISRDGGPDQIYFEENYKDLPIET